MVRFTGANLSDAFQNFHDEGILLADCEEILFTENDVDQFAAELLQLLGVLFLFDLLVQLAKQFDL